MILSFLNCKSDHALCSGESYYVVHSHNCGENVLQNVCVIIILHVEMDDGLSASLLDINVLEI